MKSEHVLTRYSRSLEEIDEIFAKSKSIFDPVRVSKNLPKQRLATFLEKESEHDPQVKAVVEKLEQA